MRKRARAALAAAGMALAITAVPTPGARADHCQAVIILSGYYVQDVGGQTLNPNGAGCINDDEGLNLNLLMPGSNVLRVGSFGTPVEGWVDVDGVVTPLVFTFNTTGQRYDSQRVPSLGAKQATATVKTITGFTVSVTYTATPQTSL